MLSLGKAAKTAVLAMMTAAAIIFSYAETLVPLSIIPLPGFKLGFANIVIVTVLYLFSAKDALAVSVARTAVVSLLFGTVMSAAFSLAGGVLSLAVMSAVKRARIFSIYAVGVAGAAAHNIGQLAAAAVTGGAPVAAYLPYLMICALATGLIMSAASCAVIKIIASAMPEKPKIIQ